MAAALATLDNTLDMGDMEFAEGHLKYSMRANWKLLVENSMDGYHAAFTHERFFENFLPSLGLSRPSPVPPPGSKERVAAYYEPVPLGNGHVTTRQPAPGGVSQ